METLEDQEQAAAVRVAIAEALVAGVIAQAQEIAAQLVREAADSGEGVPQ